MAIVKNPFLMACCVGAFVDQHGSPIITISIILFPSFRAINQSCYRYTGTGNLRDMSLTLYLKAGPINTGSLGERHFALY